MDTKTQDSTFELLDDILSSGDGEFIQMHEESMTEAVDKYSVPERRALFYRYYNEYSNNPEAIMEGELEHVGKLCEAVVKAQITFTAES